MLDSYSEEITGKCNSDFCYLTTEEAFEFNRIRNEIGRIMDFYVPSELGNKNAV